MILPVENFDAGSLIQSKAEHCDLERALPTEAAQLAGLNHSYRARQSTLCSREGSTNSATEALTELTRGDSLAPKV